MVVNVVTLSRAARKALGKAPQHVVMKLLGWAIYVITEPASGAEGPFVDVREVGKHDS